MAKKLAQAWTLIAVVLPVLIGIMLLVNPSGFIPRNTEVLDLARTLGLRNIAISSVLLYAFFTQSKKVVAFLLLVRGSTEIADALAVFIGTPQIAPPVLIPFILAALTFSAAYMFLKVDKE